MKLAINGGKMVTTNPFPHQLSINWQEIDVVKQLMEKAALGEVNLSSFRGNWSQESPGFYGGEWVQKLERKWEKYFNIKKAISVNSCTSALQIACGAIGLAPGDEVIVTPWSMSCSATAPLLWNAIPIFADINPVTYCLDPDSIKEKITKKTKAIIVVDLFGQPADYDKIKEIANDYGLYIIEDAAQAIGSKYKDKYTGTLGDIGCFSFTQGKHLTAGEGGMIVTDNEVLALRCQMIRNHAEAVNNDMGSDRYNLDFGFSPHNNMLGFNMRMTEIQAAILYYQLDKLKDFIYRRIINVEKIWEGIKRIPLLLGTFIPPDNTHSYYVHTMRYIQEESRIHRDLFIKAVAAELPGEKGRPDKPMLGCGYIKPLYLFPLFDHTLLYGQTFYPWKDSKRIYRKGICPVTENLWKNTLFTNMYHSLPLDDLQIQYIIDAFWKVYNNIEELK